MALNMYHPIYINGAIYRIDQGKILGKGSYGCVYKAFDDNNHAYAIKEFDFNKVDDAHPEKRRQEILNEVQIMQSLNHKYIIKYYGYAEDKSNKKMYILMELATKSLRKFCNDKLLPPFAEREKFVRNIMFQICRFLFTSENTILKHIITTGKKPKIQHPPSSNWKREKSATET